MSIRFHSPATDRNLFASCPKFASSRALTQSLTALHTIKVVDWLRICNRNAARVHFQWKSTYSVTFSV